MTYWPDTVLTRQHKGRAIYRRVIHSYYTLPDAVQVTKTDVNGDSINGNKIAWIATATLDNYWTVHSEGHHVS